MEKLKQKLLNREKIFISTISDWGWGGVPHLFKDDALDLLMIDVEHGHLGWETCENLLRTCNNLSLPVIVRAVDTEYHLMSKYLDMGADGLLVPRVETVEQALAAVSYMRFPPKGKKGCGGFSLLRGDNAFAKFNSEKMLFLQIESLKAVDNLDSMLTDCAGEVSGVLIGPSDLSISMGNNSFDFRAPDFLAVVEQVFSVCDDHSVSCGIFCVSDESIRFWRSKGANLIWAGSDVGLFLSAYRDLCQTIRELD